MELFKCVTSHSNWGTCMTSGLRRCCSRPNIDNLLVMPLLSDVQAATAAITIVSRCMRQAACDTHRFRCTLLSRLHRVATLSARELRWKAQCPTEFLYSWRAKVRDDCTLHISQESSRDFHVSDQRTPIFRGRYFLRSKNCSNSGGLSELFCRCSK